MPLSRQARHLLVRYRAIAAYLGLIACLLGLLLLAPLVALLAWPGEAAQAWPFVLTGLILAAGGGGLWRWFRPAAPLALTLPEGAVIVLGAWLLAVGMGALPLMPTAGLNFTQAAFEAASGWTTTGLSVVDVEKASHLLLLYRSVMQLAGGAGLAILLLAAFGGPLGVGLSSAEGRDLQLVPQVRRSTRLVVGIYSALNLLGVAALKLAGMGWFDAVNHAFCALSTGGFSTRAASLGAWDQPGVEAVIIALMLLGNLNFLTLYALGRGKWRNLHRNAELRLLAFLLPLAAVVLYLGAVRYLFPSLPKAARTAVFETVSALTTTGFSTLDYSRWNSLGLLLLTLLMLVGGGVCSTAGGLKQLRVYALYRVVVWELRRLLQPAAMVGQPSLWVGEAREFLDDTKIRRLGLFLFAYLTLLFLGTLLLTAHGYDVGRSFFEFASALGTVGLSVGVTAPDAPPAVLWAETVAMVLGRLEILVVGVALGKLGRDAKSFLS
ncbi:MAG: TrkH family potassium uptake protein [Deltaproteobacteria bacterium]|nr:TrkH family potassium uptake protein [Deltaproteobacteria bacterium]